MHDCFLTEIKYEFKFVEMTNKNIESAKKISYFNSAMTHF